jgi:hypothetical protein
VDLAAAARRILFDKTRKVEVPLDDLVKSIWKKRPPQSSPARPSS